MALIKYNCKQTQFLEKYTCKIHVQFEHNYGWENDGLLILYTDNKFHVKK